MLPQAIDVIGLGVGEQAHISPSAHVAIEQADHIIGSERQIETLAHLDLWQPCHVLPKLSELDGLLQQLADQRVAILASGDPLYFGIATWLLKRYPSIVKTHPALSSIQAACHAVGIALQDARVVTLHGRPLSNLVRHLSQSTHLVLLTDAASNPQAVAELCLEHGYDQSELWVCERLGYADQSVKHKHVNSLDTWRDEVFNELQVTILKVGGEARWVTAFPGFDDNAFVTNPDPGQPTGKGLLTKKEVRLNVLSLLAPKPCETGWDIGAGCGGVSVEWAFWHETATIHAIEHHPDRLTCLRANQARFGVNNLQIIGGYAPDALEALPDPDVIFIGGSDGRLEELLKISWQRLKPGGRLVASAVTEDTKAILHRFMQHTQAQHSQAVQIAVSQASELAGQLLYRPALPVTLTKMVK